MISRGIIIGEKKVHEGRNWVKKTTDFFKKKSRIIIYISLLLTIIFGVIIRIRNLPYMKWKYPLALDPYVFLRYARYISEHGSMMAHDAMRYYPLGFNVKGETMLVSYVVVYMHKIVLFFNKNITIEAIDIIYPVIFFVLGVLAFFFLVKNLFNEKTALLATLLLSIIPAYVYRTMAGFSDKEPLALFFMFCSMLFFYKAFRSKKFKIVYYAISGFATGLMAVTWGGFKFILLIIPGFLFIMIIFGKTEKNDLTGYAIWTILFTFFSATFTNKYGNLKGLLTSTTTSFSYFVLIFFVGYLMYNNISFIKKNSKAILGIGIIAVLAGALIFRNLISLIFNDVRDLLLSGMAGSRLMTTVAEAKTPFLSDWLSAYVMLFFIFIAGIIFIFHQGFRKVLPKKERVILTSSFSIMIIGILFSRASKYSTLNGSTIQSKTLLFSSIILFVLATCYIAFKLFQNKEHGIYNFKKAEPSMIFLAVWFLVMLFAARSGLRLFLIFTPVLCVIVAFFAIELIRKATFCKDKVYKYTAYFMIILFLVPQILGFAGTSYEQADQYAPSFNEQWQTAMGWVQSNTDENSVFAHWWDYGYWIQTEGNRATITDGGNFISYWNHLMGRHVLSARSEKEALEFLYAHNASHLLIISDEIMKYGAYSSIGSDENFDIFSWIGTYTMDSSMTQVNEEKNIVNYYFRGGAALDEDLTYKGKVFPKKDSYILRFKIPVHEKDGEIMIMQPTAFVYSEGKNEEVPVECVYDEGKKMFEKEGLKGCLRIYPLYIDYRHQQENGALLYVSEKGMNSLWTQLFLFNSSNENFRLVYDDSRINSLAYFNGQILGPLKIWEINYPENFSINDSLRQRYLNRTTPEWMRLSVLSTEI